MKGLSDLLNKYRLLIKDDSGLKKLVSEAIKDVTNLEIKAETIKLKEGDIFLSCSPTIGSEIFLRKEAILSKIKEKTKKNFREIRFR